MFGFALEDYTQKLMNGTFFLSLVIFFLSLNFKSILLHALFDTLISTLLLLT